MIESSSKIYDPKTYDETIHNLIYGNRWCKVIGKKLWNLDSYSVWCYKEWSFEKKTIRFKWVFKVKYKLDRMIERYKVRLVAQGFFQVPWVDFTKTFTSITR